jgi:hypothetical protein
MKSITPEILETLLIIGVCIVVFLLISIPFIKESNKIYDLEVSGQVYKDVQRHYDWFVKDGVIINPGNESYTLTPKN